ncbi:MAG: 50S ribosomal protein L30 [Myxococcales bacterium]|nr:50S ribosomal protein L30 [Myxococcales bacterium]
MAKKVKVTQTRSVIGRPGVHKRTIKALGLRKINDSVVHEDSPSIRGMIFHVKHLVQVEEVNDGT